MSELMLFAGNACPELAHAIAARLNTHVSQATVGKFSDGEINIEIREHVRGRDVFIIQSTCNPTNDNLMELVIMADALRRASAGRISAVIPYFGYARQDRRVRSARVPISAKVVADMLSIVGVNRVLTVDLHADQVQGFFDVPVDNVYGTPVMIDHINGQHFPNKLIVSPDVGGVVRARAVAKRLGDVDLAIIDKRRPAPNVAEVMHIIGEVEGRDCIIIDDIVDTAGTLSLAANALKAHGARSVNAYCTHAVLSGRAVQNVVKSGLDKLVVTDTIPLRAEAKTCEKIETVSLAPLLAEAIRRVSEEESLSEMFI
ncbi:ribose-phosphate pyrophosphokinase [Permianibacter aggregans]|uniref:Ribose-phosphate pyrophosphokinase n=1 Tax=Permianibacter aggregans TaxID=1510150 RepID=A0A4R6UMW8_9GAMM|nr:ribose-phosphate pyrophosphokinase [Permianibacter aggregans]QGX40731.1 ribose-phosphate pyrophosphokinase [Permianibacter aggregans]TDQ48458.1 ribose-phosphate pyrophosphokinase [Permianibacter aggregans]